MSIATGVYIALMTLFVVAWVNSAVGLIAASILKSSRGIASAEKQNTTFTWAIAVFTAVWVVLLIVGVA